MLTTLENDYPDSSSLAPLGPALPADPCRPAAGTGSDSADPSGWTALIRRAQAEFAEMPGLQLTLAQATRLWALDARITERMLTALVGCGFLVRRGDRYTRATSA